MKPLDKIYALAALILILVAAAAVKSELKLTDARPELTDEQWSRLKAGKQVSKVWNEGGTQSAGRGYGIFKLSPGLMWKAICSFELYDKFIKRTTVSVLVDEKTRDQILKDNLQDADEVEKLFQEMKPGCQRKDSGEKWTVYSYQRNELPWPVSDRWVLLEITHDDKQMRQTWKRLAGNIKQDFGYWQLYPLENGQTLGETEIHLDANIPATRLLTDYALAVSFPATYQSFEKIAEHLANKK